MILLTIVSYLDVLAHMAIQYIPALHPTGAPLSSFPLHEMIAGKPDTARPPPTPYPLSRRAGPTRPR